MPDCVNNSKPADNALFTYGVMAIEVRSTPCGAVLYQRSQAAADLEDVYRPAINLTGLTESPIPNAISFSLIVAGSIYVPKRRSQKVKTLPIFVL